MDETIIGNFQKTLEDMITETKRTIFVSAFNCETRPVSLISDTLDSGASFIILDPFSRIAKSNLDFPATKFTE